MNTDLHSLVLPKQWEATADFANCADETKETPGRFLPSHPRSSAPSAVHFPGAFASVCLTKDGRRGRRESGRAASANGNAQSNSTNMPKSRPRPSTSGLPSRTCSADRSSTSAARSHPAGATYERRIRPAISLSEQAVLKIEFSKSECAGLAAMWSQYNT